MTDGGKHGKRRYWQTGDGRRGLSAHTERAKRKGRSYGRFVKPTFWWVTSEKPPLVCNGGLTVAHMVHTEEDRVAYNITMGSRTHNSTLWLDYSLFPCCENVPPQTRYPEHVLYGFPGRPSHSARINLWGCILSALLLCLVLNTISVAATCDFCAAHLNAACGM